MLKHVVFSADSTAIQCCKLSDHIEHSTQCLLKTDLAVRVRGSTYRLCCPVYIASVWKAVDRQAWWDCEIVNHSWHLQKQISELIFFVLWREQHIYDFWIILVVMPNKSHLLTKRQVCVFVIFSNVSSTFYSALARSANAGIGMGFTHFHGWKVASRSASISPEVCQFHRISPEYHVFQVLSWNSVVFRK